MINADYINNLRAIAENAKKLNEQAHTAYRTAIEKVEDPEKKARLEKIVELAKNGQITLENINQVTNSISDICR